MKPDRAQTFPMRVVTRMTGLTADVVRVWERRYGAITPARTEGNARRYSSHDIERLTRLRDAIAAGHSIGDIANLADARLTALAASRDPITETRPILAPYLEAMSELDLPRGEALLARASQLLGPRAMVLDVVLPLLREVGDRWVAGKLTVAEEHAVSAQIRAHLAVLLRTTVLPTGAPRVVFATPPGHRHELGAMMAAVLASARGVSPIYLGPDVPFEEVEGACLRSRATVVVLSVLTLHESAVDRRHELRAMEKLSERIETWVGAPPGHPALDAKGVRPMSDFAAFEAALTHRFGVAGS
ncbi:MAG: MerR family transcriptional regulator [Deltaproteobacteria bacterium]|nr:MerR family transcriptional regulator [Deltaproteobacteria bacterium]